MSLPETLPIFELLVLESEELPLLCIGVKGHSRHTEHTNGQLKFDIIHLDDTPQDKPGTECVEPVHDSMFSLLSV